jgi:dipeptidyl aminopeptidase/acylaminoacyl peptidase
MKTNSLLPMAFVAVAFATPALAQQAAPLSPQDLVTLNRLGGGAIAPDGKLVAYVVTTTDPVSYKRTPTLWLRSTDGKGEPRRIDTGGSASDPAFGPDGGLYYLARWARRKARKFGKSIPPAV